MIRKTAGFFKRFSTIVNDAQVSTYAASASFFSIIAIFPIIILFANILPLTNLNPDYIFKFLKDFLPGFVVKIVNDAYSEFSSFRGVLISITSVMILWTAGSGVWSMMNGMNAINGVKERRNWLLVHFIATLYTIIFLVLIIFAVVFLILGNKMYKALDKNFYGLSIVYLVINRFRFIFIWFFLLVMFMSMYTAFSSKKLLFHAQFPGALISSVSWTIISWAYSKFIDAVGLNGVYGTFATFIFCFFWLYWTMYFIFIGAIINTFFESYFVKKHKNKLERRRIVKEYKVRQRLIKKGLIPPDNSDLDDGPSPEASSGRYE